MMAWNDLVVNEQLLRLDPSMMLTFLTLRKMQSLRAFWPKKGLVEDLGDLSTAPRRWSNLVTNHLQRPSETKQVAKPPDTSKTPSLPPPRGRQPSRTIPKAHRLC
jgi:hypothetical protein